MTISIIIPAFNEEELLPKCLESLRNQDYEGDYEVIVVDDGSTDNTSRIAKKFGARVISCAKRGIIYARQTGIYAATGEIIVQADGDTIYPQDWLIRIAQHFSSHPEVVAIAGNFIYADPPYWAKIEYGLRNAVNALSIIFGGGLLFVSGANFSFRREAFLKVGGYKEETLSPDQYGICARLSRVGKVLYDKTLSVSTSSRRVQKAESSLIIDGLGHLARICAYFLKESISSLQVRRPSLKTCAKLSLSISLISAIGITADGYYVPTSQVFGKVYYRGNSPEKIMALTFDDGPNEPYTSEILDTLDRYGIKATFFVIGKNVELYPETAKRIMAEGHVLGNHSYSHNANHALTSKGSKDLQVAENTIFETVGVKTNLYRPPHGKKSPWELRSIKRENLVEVTWSLSTNELHAKSPESVAQKIISKAGPGKIVLFHDGYGTSHNSARSDKSLTVKALPLVIENLQRQGYKFVTVPELLGIAAYD